jgi:hypothetical protein
MITSIRNINLNPHVLRWGARRRWIPVNAVYEKIASSINRCLEKFELHCHGASVIIQRKSQCVRYVLLKANILVPLEKGGDILI